MKTWAVGAALVLFTAIVCQHLEAQSSGRNVWYSVESATDFPQLFSSSSVIITRVRPSKAEFDELNAKQPRWKFMYSPIQARNFEQSMRRLLETEGYAVETGQPPRQAQAVLMDIFYLRQGRPIAGVDADELTSIGISVYDLNEYSSDKRDTMEELLRYRVTIAMDSHLTSQLGKVCEKVLALLHSSSTETFAAW